MAVLLSPILHKFYEEVGGSLPMTTSEDAGDFNSDQLTHFILKLKSKHKIKSRDFIKRKIKYSHKNIILASAHTSGCEKEQCQLQHFMSYELIKFSNSHIFVIGQDSSAQVGIREKHESDEIVENTHSSSRIRKTRKQSNSINAALSK